MSTLIYENIEFHNVAELEEVLGLPGFRLQRFLKKCAIAWDMVIMSGTFMPRYQ